MHLAARERHVVQELREVGTARNPAHAAGDGGEGAERATLQPKQAG